MEDSEIIEKAKKKFNSTFYNTIYEQLAEKLTIEEAIVLARQDEKEKQGISRDATECIICKNKRKMLCYCNSCHKNEIEKTRTDEREKLAYNDEQHLADIEEECYNKGKQKGFLEAIESMHSLLENAEEGLEGTAVEFEETYKDAYTGAKQIIKQIQKDFDEIKKGVEK